VMSLRSRDRRVECLLTGIVSAGRISFWRLAVAVTEIMASILYVDKVN
jgi:hypothetical protein